MPSSQACKSGRCIPGGSGGLVNKPSCRSASRNSLYAQLSSNRRKDVLEDFRSGRAGTSACLYSNETAPLIRAVLQEREEAVRGDQGVVLTLPRFGCGLDRQDFWKFGGLHSFNSKRWADCAQAQTLS